MGVIVGVNTIHVFTQCALLDGAVSGLLAASGNKKSCPCWQCFSFRAHNINYINNILFIVLCVRLYFPQSCLGWP